MATATWKSALGIQSQAPTQGPYLLYSEAKRMTKNSRVKAQDRDEVYGGAVRPSAIRAIEQGGHWGSAPCRSKIRAFLWPCDIPGTALFVNRLVSGPR